MHDKHNSKPSEVRPANVPPEVQPTNPPPEVRPDNLPDHETAEYRSLSMAILGSVADGVAGGVAGGIAGAATSKITDHLLDGRKPSEGQAEQPPKKAA